MVRLRRDDFWLILVLLGAAVAAWLLRHVEDDAFITFRYSQHLADGLGPVWNPNGPPVEGYTNFLWMLLMAIPHALGIEVVTFSHLLSTSAFLANVYLSFRLIKLLIKSNLYQWVVLVLVAANYTLLGYATSGLETAFNGMLVTGFLLWAVQSFRSPPSLERLVLGGLLAGILLLSRHDNLILLISVLAFFMTTQKKHQIPLKRLGAFLFTMVTIMVPFLLWRHNFYGAWLPNTFYAKGQMLEWQDGLFYVLAFVAVSGVFLPLLGSLTMIRSSAKMPFPSHLLGLFALAWAAYLFLIGGDYMEFRMWVPAIPALFIWLGGLLSHHGKSKVLVWTALGCLLAFNLLHAYGHGRWYQLRFVTPIHRAVSEGAPPYFNLIDQAKGIDQLFAGKQLSFATGNCGAYAYYNSGLTWVDIYGLNDAWVARNGTYTGIGPGHRIRAPFSYLIDQKVNLVSVACYHQSQMKKIRPFTADAPAFQAVLGDYRPRPGDPGISIVELPVDEDFVLVCLYLHPSLTVEVMTAKGKLPAAKALNFLK